jgi:polar amino acid transport system substrate-binding protein
LEGLVRSLLIGASLAVLIVDACNTAPTTTPAPTVAADVCAKNVVKHPGQLTMSTDSPALAPWWGGETATQYTVEPSPGSGWEVGDPYGMEGYESGVSYSLADALGFQPNELEWIKNDGHALDAGPKPFDIYIAHVPASDVRARNVDFSRPYFDSPVAVVAIEGNDINAAKSVTDLKSYSLGAVANSSGPEVIAAVVKPAVTGTTYPDRATALAALTSGEIDGFVTEMNTAFYLRDGWHEDRTKPLANATIVGRIADALWTDHFALVLEKDSPLTVCANVALDKITAQNFLEEYKGEYIVDDNDVPVLN